MNLRTRIRRRNRRLVPALAVLSLLAGLLASVPTAPVAAAEDKPDAIVSLGDSFISGEAGRWQGNGNGNPLGSRYGTDRAAVNCSPGEGWCSFDPGRVYGDTKYDAPAGTPGKACHRSDVAEIRGAEYLGIPVERRFNLACSGAVTADVTSRIYQGEAPQTTRLRELAGSYDVKLIVLSIGGNDLEFSPIIVKCVMAFMLGYAEPSHCNRTADPGAEKLAAVRAKISATITAIKEAMYAAGQAPDSYTLVAQSYPGPIARGDDNRYPEKFQRNNEGGCPFYNDDSTWARDQLVPTISDTVQDAVADARDVEDGFSPVFLDLQDAFSGHELCSKQARQAADGDTLAHPQDPATAEWIRWIPYLKVETGGQGHRQEAIHPNAFGQQVLSRCLTELVSVLAGGNRDFSCTNTPGRFTEGVRVQPLPAGNLLDPGEYLVRNLGDGEVLGAEDGGDAWLDTEPYGGADHQKWTVADAPEERLSLRAKHNGQYLHGNPFSQWAYQDESYSGEWWLAPTPGGVVIQTVSDDSTTFKDLCLARDHESELGTVRTGLEQCDPADARQKWRFDKVPSTGGPVGMRPRADTEPNKPAPHSTDPAAHPGCRPDGMTPTPGVNTPYCLAYDGDGRELLGSTFERRVVGYFTGWRGGESGGMPYLPSDIPWGQVTHVNYAFAHVGADNRISVGAPGAGNPATGMTWPWTPGAEMDPTLPYQGHFNLLNKYKKEHPRVKTLISVGGWADSGGFYTLTVNADGSVNQPAIDAFADSTVDFLRQYGFDGADIDYEYPTALPDTGNPADWDVANPRRAGLTAGYNALMKTLREKLDAASAADQRYYQLTAAGSGSGYLVRGMADFSALQYLDFVNDMSYDIHGSWNNFVGPNAPLYDDGRDAELIASGVYDEAEYGDTGYFNADWSYHYFRGALQSGRINLGLPYYTRGWKNVTGGVGNGLWGTSTLPDQGSCPDGTGGNGGRVPCGAGATGNDNIWHDLDAAGNEVGAGSNPMWHAKNLERGITPGYLGAYGLDPADPANSSDGYTRHWDDTLKASWLWNDAKKTFLSTEDEQAIAAKADYVVDKNLGGVMIWELAGDYHCPDQGQCGPGYTLTNLLDDKLRGAGAYGAERSTRELPAEVLDVGVEFVEYPTTIGRMWPMQPKLRVTNKTGTSLVKGTEISFDIPTSAPALVKDGGGQVLPDVEPGHTGANVGGLRGDFHRVTLTLGYCEDIAPGAVRDIPLQYYLPVTGPANVEFTIGGTRYGSTGDHRRGVTTVDPPPASGSCQAPAWDPARDYEPGGSLKWTLWDKGAGTWQVEYKGGSVLDHHPGEHRAHLVGADPDNGNQKWAFTDAGDGRFTIRNAGLCLTAGTAGGDLTVEACDGGADQRWRLEGLDGGGSTPAHGKRYKILSDTDTAAEPAGGAATPGTRVLAGDPSGEQGVVVSHNGHYWRALWWTRPGEEPGVAPVWKLLS